MKDYIDHEQVSNFGEIQEIADLKKAKKGGFSRRLYLEKVETDK